jgi:hypothetical protein
MTITKSGNVGIGTTSPRDISGYRSLAINAGTGSILDLFVNGTLTSSFVAEASATYLVSQTSSPLIFRVNGSDRATITSSGNVGIGTSSPSSKLQVDGSNSNGLIQAYVTAGGGNALRLNSNFASGNYIDLNPYISGVSNGGFEIIQNGTQRFVINSGGNVGIGTTSPAYKLEVAGNARITSTTLIQYGGADTWFGYGGSYDNYFSTPNGGKQVFRNASSEIMTLTSTGNVGIGTTSPTQKLDVNGNAVVLGFLQAGDASILGAPSYGLIPTAIIGKSPAGVLDIRNTNGTVNAGDTAGIIQFSVKGDATPGYTVARIDVSTQNNTTTGNSGGGNIKFLTSVGGTGAFPTERMRITNTGNVGIGTTIPGYTLHVNGSVAGTSAYVNLSDERYKKDIQPIENALDKILSLNGVTFNWDKSKTDMNLDDVNHIGLIAQEVEKVLPQAVTTGSDDNEIKSVSYTDIVPVLIEAIKQQQAQIEELKAKLK